MAKTGDCIRVNSPGPCVIPWAFHEHFSFFEEIYSLRGVES